MSQRVAAAVATMIALLPPAAGLADEPAGTPLHTFRGAVVGVVDGDTVDVLVAAETARALGYPPRKSPKQTRLRLYGIDARERGQPFGKNAKQVLSGIALRKEVAVAVVVRDGFGRLVALLTGKALKEAIAAAKAAG